MFLCNIFLSAHLCYLLVLKGRDDGDLLILEKKSGFVGRLREGL